MADDTTLSNDDVIRLIADASERLAATDFSTAASEVVELVSPLPTEVRKALLARWLTRLAETSTFDRNESYLQELAARLPNDEGLIKTFMRSSQSVDSKSTEAASDNEVPSAEHARAIPDTRDLTDGDHLSTVVQDESANESLTGPSNVSLESFGDYDLYEELGQGGMGVVFRARQRSANRIVALKLIRTDRLSELDSKRRATVVTRFQAEAQAAASLEHDHLVPVYDVGEYEGRHYYSMRFIDGCSLAEETRDKPLDNVRSARYLRGVALAVAAAHDRGILHRDLKPHNVMLDRAKDRALVADFGLAKLIDVNQSATQTGEVFGSPPYMAPEQTQDASKVGESADIYGLGATLYHLITGRPPFQTASMVETIRQVNFEEPVSPRRLNPAVDKDLETICLKCLEKQKDRRYATARQLADDLGNFLAGKPISARPTGRVARAGKWVRKHPVPAALSMVTVICVIGFMLATGIGYYSTSQALKREQEQRQKASENLALAVQAVDESLLRINESSRLKAAGLEDLRRSLVEAALPFLEKFTETKQDDPDLIRMQIQAFQDLGQVQMILGDVEESEESLRQSLQLATSLLAENKSSEEIRFDVAQCHRELGRLLLDQGQFVEAESEYITAIDQLEELHEASPDSLSTIDLLASCHNEIGFLFATFKSDLGNAEQSFRLAISLREELDIYQPNFPRNVVQLAALRNAIGNIVVDVGRLQEGVDIFAEALAVLRENELTLQSDPDFLPSLANLEYSLASGLIRLRRNEDAQPHLEAAIETQVELARVQSSRPSHTDRLAVMRTANATLLMRQGNAVQAIAELDQSILEMEPIVEKFRNPSFRSTLADSRDARGSFLTALEQYDRAAPDFARMNELRQSLVDEFPTNLGYREKQATGHFNTGIFFYDQQDYVHAERDYLSSIEGFRVLVEKAPEKSVYRVSLIDALNNLALVYEDSERLDEARDTYKEILPVLRSLDESNPEVRIQSARVNYSIAEIQRSAKNFQAGLQYLNESIATLNQLNEELPGFDKTMDLLAISLVDRAECYGELGEVDKGQKDWTRAIAVAPFDMKPEFLLRRAAWTLKYSGDEDR